VSGSFGGSLSGLAPLGATIATDLNGGLSALAQTGGALATNINTGLSGLAGGFNAVLPGLQASLTGGLSGLNASLNAALSGSLGGSLSGLGPLGATLAADFSNGLSGLVKGRQRVRGELGYHAVGCGGRPELCTARAGRQPQRRAYRAERVAQCRVVGQPRRQPVGVGPTGCDVGGGYK